MKWTVIYLFCIPCLLMGQYTQDGLVPLKIDYFPKEKLREIGVKKILYPRYDSQFVFEDGRLKEAKTEQGRVILDYKGERLKEQYYMWEDEKSNAYKFKYDKSGKIQSAFTKDTVLDFRYSDQGQLVEYPTIIPPICDFMYDEYENELETNSVELVYAEGVPIRRLIHPVVEKLDQYVHYDTFLKYWDCDYLFEEMDVLIDSLDIRTFVKQYGEKDADLVVLQLADHYHLFISLIPLSSFSICEENMLEVAEGVEVPQKVCTDIYVNFWEAKDISMLAESCDTMVNTYVRLKGEWESVYSGMYGEVTDASHAFTRLDDGRYIMIKHEHFEGNRYGMCGGVETDQGGVYELKGDSVQLLWEYRFYLCSENSQYVSGFGISSNVSMEYEFKSCSISKDGYIHFTFEGQELSLPLNKIREEELKLIFEYTDEEREE